MAAHQTEVYTIWCAFSDESTQFNIQIESNQSVNQLKDRIKTKVPNKLATTDAHHLKLYHVEIPNIAKMAADDAAAAVTQKLSERPTELWQRQILADVFNGRVKEEALIIVQTPDSVPTTTRPNHLPGLQAPNTNPLQNGHNVYSELAAVKALIEQFLTSLRPKIKDFFTHPGLPNWVPPESVDNATREFYKDVAIPLVNGKPSLLLHGLGDNLNPNVDDLFRFPKSSPDSVGDPPQKYRFFCNTSGSGKTRLLLEGLCQNWGFYFVAAAGTDGIGSEDLERVIDRMSSAPGWIFDIFTDPNPEKVLVANANNEHIAVNTILKVLVARWTVFRLFIEVAKELNGGALYDDIRSRWLLFQILPFVRVNGVDPFLGLIHTCLLASVEALELLLAQLSPQEVLGPAFNPADDNFFYVVDAAHIADRKHTRAFSDAKGKIPRSVLRSILRDLASLSDSRVKIIVSGFSPEMFKTALASGAGKDSSMWDVAYKTGDFMDKDTQLAYISRYLPPSFLVSESGKILKSRMYEWLRGRYAFTVRYLEELMRRSWEGNHPASPHKLLNTYIHQFTDFTPLDGDSVILGQEADVEPINIEQGILEELSHSLYLYTIGGQYPTWHLEWESLVETWLARFIAKDKVAIDEPLPLVGIVRYSESQHLTLGPKPLVQVDDVAEAGQPGPKSRRTDRE